MRGFCSNGSSSNSGSSASVVYFAWNVKPKQGASTASLFCVTTSERHSAINIHVRPMNSPSELHEPAINSDTGEMASAISTAEKRRMTAAA